MPVLKTSALPFFPAAFVHWSRQTPQHFGMITPASEKNVSGFLTWCSSAWRSYLASGKWEMLFSIKDGLRSLLYKGHNDSWEQHRGNRDRKSDTQRHTQTHTGWGALSWSSVFMKMEINVTKKYHHFKIRIKNLYTLHVLIKVTEPVRILDSSCI